MKALFVDTSGWMALADRRDPSHQAARKTQEAWLEGGGVFVSTDYVVDETLTLLRVRLSLDAAGRWWEQVEASQRVRWEWIDPERAEKARRWFFRWTDKAFSFTDCTSFVVMRELRLRRALALDEHFRQAGFEVAP